MRISSHKKIHIDEENPYWMSFADLMSVLLVIFILASLILILELTQQKDELRKIQTKAEKDSKELSMTKQKVNVALEELRKAETIRQTILEEIVEELASQHNIQVELNANKTILRIPESLAFASGKYDIPNDPNTQDIIKKIGLAIYQAITKQRDGKYGFDYLDTVFIEGHTDSVQHKGLMGKGNWGLSAFRAISLWDFWNTDLPVFPSYNSLKNHDGEALFSVSGYADSRRINLNEIDDSERAQNRRIDIRFTIRKPTNLDLEQLIELTQ